MTRFMLRWLLPVLSLILSLLLHLVLYFGVNWIPWPKDEIRNWRSEPIEVEVVQENKGDQEKNKEKEKILVRQAEVPDTERDLSKKARFLSERLQRVVKETQASRSGLTQNQTGTSLTEQSSAGKKHSDANNAKLNQMVESKSKNNFELGGLNSEQMASSTSTKQPELMTGTFKALQKSASGRLSSVGEMLPKDVAIGEMTALNTDAYTYYSFFSRIEEMIRYRWESRVEQAIYNMTGRSLGKSGTQWLTHLEVWLNPAGDVIATKILKESGIKLFDSAGVEAFREAKVFSNPPKELVESDGVIRIRYGFNVNWNPSALVLKHD